MFKRILCLSCALMMILALAGCNNPTPPVVEEPPVNSDTQPENLFQNKKMIVDTEEYTLTFDILGSWTEYAGNSEIRELAKTVLSSTATSNANSSTFFYVLIDKYDESAEQTLKDKIVTEIKERYDTVEFESINETKNNDEETIISIYTVSENTETIKKYQYTIKKYGYEISFVYSAPTLIYNSQKGYINDMIKSAEFKLVETQVQ